AFPVSRSPARNIRVKQGQNKGGGAEPAPGTVRISRAAGRRLHSHARWSRPSATDGRAGGKRRRSGRWGFREATTGTLVPDRNARSGRARSYGSARRARG